MVYARKGRTSDLLLLFATLCLRFVWVLGAFSDSAEVPDCRAGWGGAGVLTALPTVTSESGATVQSPSSPHKCVLGPLTQGPTRGSGFWSLTAWAPVPALPPTPR